MTRELAQVIQIRPVEHDAPHPAVGHLLPADGEKKTHAAFFANPTMSGVGAGSFCGTAQAAFAASPTISLMIAFKSKFFGV